MSKKRWRTKKCQDKDKTAMEQSICKKSQLQNLSIPNYDDILQKKMVLKALKH